MAGTDLTQRGLGDGIAAGAPAIILIEPQLGENIGTTARAMLNCGLTEMRLVKPRDGWPNPYAQAAASGADVVLEGATLFATAEEAVADLEHVYATSARPRDMIKPVVHPRRLAAELRRAQGVQAPTGILFGPERTGLRNEHLVLAESLVEVPLNPAFCSLNLAQAVLLVGYEWFQSGLEETALTDTVLPYPGARPAKSEDVRLFFEHLEAELDATGFLRPLEKRPRMVRNLRNLFLRARLSDNEVRTLRGVVRYLAQHEPQRDPEDGP
jgi:tRNA/rRNA methyltransferase